MKAITIYRGDTVLGHHTTDSSMSHYGQPVWQIEDDEPEPGPATWHQDGQNIYMDIIGVIGGWLVCRQPGGLLIGIIWSDGNYYAECIVKQATGKPIRRGKLTSGQYEVRGTIPFPESPLGAILC